MPCFLDAHQRKQIRYLDLEEEIKLSHYKVKTHPIQIGCRGFIDVMSFECTRELATQSLGSREWKAFLRDIPLPAGVYLGGGGSLAQPLIKNLPPPLEIHVATISLSIPVSTTSVEKSFSQIKLIKARL